GGRGGPGTTLSALRVARGPRSTPRFFHGRLSDASRRRRASRAESADPSSAQWRPARFRRRRRRLLFASARQQEAPLPQAWNTATGVERLLWNGGPAEIIVRRPRSDAHRRSPHPARLDGSL